MTTTEGTTTSTTTGGQTSGTTGGTETGQTGSDQGGTGQQTGQTGGQTSGQQTAAQDVASLPDWAQKLIKDTRTEAAGHRTKANDLEKASQAQLDAIAKALGLKPADADPVKLAEELAKAQTASRTSQVELAVHRLAGKKGIDADAEALLDSRGFAAAVADLDPSASDFASKVEAAIKDAVKANPKLKAGTTTGASTSGGEFTGGTGAGNPITEAQLAKMTPAEVAKAYAEGKLKHLM